MDREACRATVQGVSKESDTTERLRRHVYIIYELTDQLSGPRGSRMKAELGFAYSYHEA